MSVKLMSKAWETNQKGNHLLVLLALCDFANDEGDCFPSLKTLCEKAKISKSALSYILKAYESVGVISREKRKRDNQSDTSTSYKILTLTIDESAYQNAYQNARNYKKSPQCEHPQKEEKNHNVNTLNANCEHLEPSYIINHQLEKKEIKKSILDEVIENEKPNDSEIAILRRFIDYRKTIKKTIKTTQPIKLFLTEIRKINEAGIDVVAAIKIMAEREWQSIQLDWIQKILSQSNNNALAVPAQNNQSKTFYEQTEEKKVEKQNKTLNNIAAVRQMMKEGKI